jgi:hypothetical protein
MTFFLGMVVEQPRCPKHREEAHLKKGILTFSCFENTLFKIYTITSLAFNQH